jgi:acyl carrier protein
VAVLVASMGRDPTTADLMRRQGQNAGSGRHDPIFSRRGWRSGLDPGHQGPRNEPQQRAHNMSSIEIAEILEQVRFIFADHLCVPLDMIVESATLQEDLAMDSLDWAEICIALEESFDVEISEMHVFRTVFDVAAFLSNRVLPTPGAVSQLAGSIAPAGAA